LKAITTSSKPWTARAALRRGLRASSIEGMLATPICQMALPVNLFLTALITKGYRLSTVHIGVLTSLPFLCNFLQVFITPLASRWLTPKVTTITGTAAHFASWLWLAVMIPGLPADRPEEAGRALITWFFVSSLCQAVAAVGWNTWMHDLVPPRLRGRYFATRNRAGQVSTLVFALTTGWVLARGSYTPGVFQAVTFGACALRLISFYYFAQMPARRHHEIPPLPVAQQFAIVVRSHSLLWFIMFGAVWSFAANSFGPFYHVFLFEHLRFSAFDVGVLMTIAALGGVCSLPVWGPLLDRFGNRSVMAVALGLWQTQNFLWFFLTPENRYIVYGMWLVGGSLSAGFVLGQFTILLKLIPLPARNLAIGCNLAVTSLVAAASPIAGAATLSWLLQQVPAPAQAYHLVFLVQPVVAILGCLLLLRVAEPASSPLATVVGAMRNIRTLSGVLGLGFLVNYLFVRIEKHASTPAATPPARQQIGGRPSAKAAGK
jgi:MFS family permease